MDIKTLLVAPPRVKAGKADVQFDAPRVEGTPVFLTPQALVTFPGASLVVLVVWRTLGSLIPVLNSSNWVPFIASMFVGGIIYCVSTTDTMTGKDKLIGAFLGFVNSCYVALFVIGVPLTFPPTVAPTSGATTKPAAVHSEPPAVVPAGGESPAKSP